MHGAAAAAAPMVGRPISQASTLQQGSMTLAHADAPALAVALACHLLACPAALHAVQQRRQPTHPLQTYRADNAAAARNDAEGWRLASRIGLLVIGVTAAAGVLQTSALQGVGAQNLHARR